MNYTTLKKYKSTTLLLLLIFIIPFACVDKVFGSDKGLILLKKAVQAAGGEQAFKGIKNFTVKTRTTISGSQTKTQVIITETIEIPGKTKQILDFDNGSRIQVLNGNQSWKQINLTVSELSQLEKREMARGLFRDLIVLFSSYDTLNYDVRYVSDQTVSGQTLQVIQIKDAQLDFFRLFIDSATNLIVKKTYQGAAEAGYTTFEEIYSDYRDVSGIKVPYNIIVRTNGRVFIESVVSDFKINSELGEDFFYK